MRPVTKPDLSFAAHRIERGALLLAALGPYCSFCERKMPAEFWVLDVASGEILQPENTAADWEQILLICHDCSDMHRLRQFQRLQPQLGDLLLPDRDVTFVLDRESPFRYQRDDVQIVEVLESGDARQRASSEVIVHASSPEASATLQYFALNTRYWDNENTLRIPPAEQSTRLDRRVFLRTVAWQVANHVVPVVRRVRDESGGGVFAGDDAHPVALAARRIAADTGFWSTFATVYLAAFEDPELVWNLLVPPANRSSASVRLPRLQPEGLSGDINAPFPGTRMT